jgi:hypothetical protein
MDKVTCPFELIHEALLELNPEEDLLTPMDTMEDFLSKNDDLQILVDTFELDFA